MSTTTDATISVQQLQQLAESSSGVAVIDVRTPVEFRQIHCIHARNVPLDSLDPATVVSEQADAGLPIYVICKSGARAAKACNAFVAAGISNVINVEGGTDAWVAAGLPVVRGKKSMSLERQVRIAAGSLVLTGSAAGYFGPAYWIGLAAFVGAGLVFAGITDTCGMGLMLAKMPWNQIDDSSNDVSSEKCTTTR
ncbi:MAG: rhodanese-related sulfurtransferase [Planctomycetaceae bacterium]|jgi:rhodanese-related sulfurtransferase